MDSRSTSAAIPIRFGIPGWTPTGAGSSAVSRSPTLPLADDATGSSAPAVAYAAVYPLAMLLPVFGSQLLVTCLMR